MCRHVTSQYDVMICDVILWRQMTSNNEFWGERTSKCLTLEVRERSGVFSFFTDIKEQPFGWIKREVAKKSDGWTPPLFTAGESLESHV